MTRRVVNLATDATVARRLQQKPRWAKDGTGYIEVPSGTGNYLSVTDASLVPMGGEAVTIIARTNLDAPDTPTIYRFFDDSSNWWWQLQIEDNRRLSWFRRADDGSGPVFLGVESSPVPRYLDHDGMTYIALTMQDDPRRFRLFASSDGGDANWVPVGDWWIAQELSPPFEVMETAAASLQIGRGLSAHSDHRLGYLELRAGVGPDCTPGGTTVFRWSGGSIEEGDAEAHPYVGPTPTTHGTVTFVPAELRGVPIGVGDWRFVVEHLTSLTEGGDFNRLNVGTVADTQDGPGLRVVGLGWDDHLTPGFRGAEWTRGSDSPIDRPRVGEAVLTYGAEDGPPSPWEDATQLSSGDVVRWGLISDADDRAGGWLPQFTGLVDELETHYVPSVEGHVADRITTMTVVEPLSTLARVDDNALPSVVGNGDLVTARVKRLLEAAAWRYGLVALYNTESTVSLQSTNMATNRLAELYLTADSTMTVVRSDTTGACMVTTHTHAPSRLREFSALGGYATIAFHPLGSVEEEGLQALSYDVQSLREVVSPDAVVNDHRYARAGGTQQIAEHPVSIGRHGRVSLHRSDLLCRFDSTVLTVARFDNARQALTAYQVEDLTITATDQGEALLLVAAIDVGDGAEFYPPTSATDEDPHATATVRSVVHSVSPLGFGRLAWTATYALNVRTVHNLPGAALEPVA